MVTAGLKWPPEICPRAKAPVNTVNPNASATPAKPIPRLGKPAANTALPVPPNTSQNVPSVSAASFFAMLILFLFIKALTKPVVHCSYPGNDYHFQTINHFEHHAAESRFTLVAVCRGAIWCGVLKNDNVCFCCNNASLKSKQYCLFI